MPNKSTLLTLLASSATLLVWNNDVLVTRSYELAVFGLVTAACWKRGARLAAPALAVIAPGVGIGLWGFAQLAFGATVYRWATANSAVQNLALAATATAAVLVFDDRLLRARFLRLFPWIGCGIALLSVAAYWTSPGKILWIFPALYPDNWGPFPSRNNFAQFLELCLPVALYQMPRGGRATAGARILPAAILLGAGLSCASRAGAILLLAEAGTALVLLPLGGRRVAVMFALAAAGVGAAAGAGRLAERFAAPDPFAFRREIAHSTLAMIVQHPWKGFGLGTFPAVYPEFAEFDSGASVEHAHDDWLEWTAEGGVFYTALWAGIALWSVRPALRTVWGLGIPAVFLHAAVDYPFARLGTAGWVFFLLGILAHEQRKVRAAAHYARGDKSETGNDTIHHRHDVRCESQRRQSGPGNHCAGGLRRGRAPFHRDRYC